jgi:hypothetical protein
MNFQTFFEDNNAITDKTLKDINPEKLKHIVFTHDNWKIYIGDLFDNTKVYLVDGDHVRDEVIPDADFIGGGHYYAYPDSIPKGELWIEFMRNSEDESDICVHEIVEYILMKYLHEEYEEAHHKANNCEKIIRILKYVNNNNGRNHG